MKKYQNYDVEDFVLDNNFIEWVLNSDELSEREWMEFMDIYPHKKDEIAEAAYILRTVSVVEPKLSKNKQKKIWDNIGIGKRTINVLNVE